MIVNEAFGSEIIFDLGSSEYDNGTISDSTFSCSSSSEDLTDNNLIVSSSISTMIRDLNNNTPTNRFVLDTPSWRRVHIVVHMFALVMELGGDPLESDPYAGYVIEDSDLEYSDCSEGRYDTPFKYTILF